MVATRGHPDGLSAELTPPPPATPSPRKSTRKAVANSSSINASSQKSWRHTPSHVVLLWLTISLPLVAWDTTYIFLRPHSMPGGKWHAPVWSPYAIYSTVDLVYGFPAWEDKNGFTAAQATLNVVESAVYLAYLYIVAVHGKEDTKTPGRGAWSSSWWGKARVLGGQAAGAACLMGLSGSLMTMSKTMLYALNEYFSDFQGTGHNSFMTLLMYYIIPNGLWLVFSTWMTWVFGLEILEGLTVATGENVSNSKLLALKDE